MTKTLDRRSVRLATEQAIRNILGDNPLFELAETARILIAPPSIYRRMGEGRIPYIRVGSRRAITRAVIVLAKEGVRPSE